jgi:DNA polymerase-3 subunit epsilon
MENKENSTNWEKQGDDYFYGRGIEKDHTKAIEYYLKSVEDGNFYPQIKIGEIYCTSDDIKEDFEKADFWFKKVLTGNELISKYLDIGEKLSEKSYCCEEGEGYVYKLQPEKAIYWYKKAAYLGNGDAMFYLAISYKNGKGVDKDLKKSFVWFNEAYENDCTNQISTLMNLANFYEDGVVCDKNIDKAIILYNRALTICNKEKDSYNDTPSFYVDYDHVNYLNSQIQEINEKKNAIDTKPKSFYLFFDVETTGIPKNWKASYKDIENWPRLVQIAWLLYDEHENILESKSEIIKPEKFLIPKSASDIHGITTEYAIQVGKELNEVLTNFNIVLEKSNFVIAHNINFDKNTVGAEFYRLYNFNPLSNMKSICTMERSTNICKIEGSFGYKFPKLEELYYHLFHQNIENAHDAMVDTKATAKCFFELKRKNLI